MEKCAQTLDITTFFKDFPDNDIRSACIENFSFSRFPGKFFNKPGKLDAANQTRVFAKVDINQPASILERNRFRLIFRF